MNSSKNIEVPNVNLEFFRAESLSKQSKIKEFWKYLDSQDILKPYEPPKTNEKLEEVYTSDSHPPSETSSITKLPQAKSLKQKKKKVTKKNECVDSSNKLEKYLREDLRYADSVEVPYEEINAEIEAYQRRLLKCKNPKCKNDKCDCYKKKRSK